MHLLRTRAEVKDGKVHASGRLYGIDNISFSSGDKGGLITATLALDAFVYGRLRAAVDLDDRRDSTTTTTTTRRSRWPRRRQPGAGHRRTPRGSLRSSAARRSSSACSRSCSSRCSRTRSRTCSSAPAAPVRRRLPQLPAASTPRPRHRGKAAPRVGQRRRSVRRQVAAERRRPRRAAGGPDPFTRSGGVVAVVRRDLTGRAPEADRDRPTGRSPGREARLDRHPRLDPDQERAQRGRALRARSARGTSVRLSVLNSSNRRPLRGGYWVVYIGPVLDAGRGLATRGRHPRGGLPHGLHPRADLVPVSRLRTRLRAEEGMTLIELLIAMTIMSIGIAALVAGFSSGIVSDQPCAADVDRRLRSPTSRWSSIARRRSPRCPPRRSLRPRRPARTVTRTGCRSTAPGPAPSARTRAGTAGQLLRHARKPSGEGRDDQRARRLGVGAKLLFTETSTFDSSTS